MLSLFHDCLVYASRPLETAQLRWLLLVPFVGVLCGAQTTTPNQLIPATTTGTSQYGTRAGIREDISLATGGLHVYIPAISLSGKGGQTFTLGYVYDSHNYTLRQTVDPVGGTVQGGWEKVLSPGLRLTIPRLQADRVYVASYLNPSTRNTNYAYCTTNWEFSDENGTAHAFANSRDCTVDSGFNDPFYTHNISDANDGSYYRLDTTNPSAIVVKAKDGTQYRFPSLNTNAGRGDVPYWYYGDFTGIVDINGNTIGFANGIITDNVGRSIAISGGDTGSLSYLDSNGVQQTIQHRGTTRSQPGWPYSPDYWTFNSTSCGFNYPPPPPQRVPLFNGVNTFSNSVGSESLALPGGATFDLFYDQLGELIYIYYPHGGYTKYDYQNSGTNYNLGTINCTADYREVAAKNVCSSPSGSCSQLATTTYAPTTSSNGSNLSTDVTDPNGNLTHYDFYEIGYGSTNPRETDRYIYSGQSTLLQKLHTDYTTDNGSTQAGLPTGLALPYQLTTTLYDVSPAISRKVVTKYDTVTFNPGSTATAFTAYIDNPVEVDEYDYGGSLTRKTTYSWMKSGIYDISSNHLLNRLNTTTVTDPITNVQSIAANGYDSLGNVISVAASGTGISALTTQYVRNGDGDVTQSTDPKNNKTNYGYNDPWFDTACAAGASSSGHPTSITNALGHVYSYKYYSCTGLLAKATDPNKQSTQYYYDALERIAETDYPDRGSTKHSYVDTAPTSVATTELMESSPNIVERQSQVVMDGLGRIHKTELNEGNGKTVYTAVTYDNIGRRDKEWNPTRCDPDTNPDSCSGETTFGVSSYQYDPLGRILTATRPDGGVVQTTYAGNRITVRDEAGKERRQYNDGLGRLVRIDEPGPGIDSTGTTGSGAVTISGSLQSKMVQTHGPTSGGALFSISGSVDQRLFDPCRANGAPSCPLTIYNSGGVSLTINGFTASTGYSGNPGSNSTPQAVAADLAGQLSSGSSPVTVTSSGGGGTFTVAAKAQGALTNYSYMASATWNNTICPDGSPCFGSPSFYVLPYPGNGSGALTGGSDAITTTVYDSGATTITINGEPISYSWSGPGTTTASIAANLAAQITSSSSFATASLSGSTIYLTSRNIGTSANYSLSSSSTYDSGSFGGPSFGASGSGGTLTGGTDPAGIYAPYVSQYTYDAFDNLTCVVQKGQDTRAFTDCPSAPITWRPRTFVYDSLSRLASSYNPELGAIQYGYDADGNLVSKKDARGTTINFSPSDSPIDPLNRVTKKIYSTGDPAVIYSYDQSTYKDLPISNGIGRRTGMSDGSGATAWSYDAMGRTSVEQQTINSVTKSSGYKYDLAGNIINLTYPDGELVTFGYDGAGRPTSAVDNSLALTFASKATYAPGGELTGVVYGSSGGVGGITETDSYNQRLQPVAISGAISSQTVFSLGYDFHVGHGDNGNVYQIANNRDSNRTQNFSYDGLNRLQSAWTNGPKWGETFTVDAFGNLTNKGPVDGKNNHEIGLSVAAATIQNQLPGLNYDANGNLTKNGDSGYVYDADNRVTSAAGIMYTYNGDGTRVMRSDGTIDWGPGPLSRSDLSGTVTRNFVFFAGRRIARRLIPANTVDYMFSDHLGSLGVMTDAAGNIEGESDYYPFGGEQVISGGLTAYKFTGKEHDAESGLDYFGARHYSSTLGRFMSPDSFGGHLEDPQTLNRYSYVGNNPLSRTDPDGHDFYEQCLSSDHLGCTQVQTDPKNSKSTQWVQAGVDGKATIITSDSIRSGQNSATMTQNGFQVNGAQGIYFDNAASHTTDANGNDVNHNSLDISGGGDLKGFNFHVDGNCGGTCMSSGEWSAPGMTSAQAREALNANSFTIPFENVRSESGHGDHADSTQYRFGGSMFWCAFTSCPNTPHISVPFDPPNAYPKYGVPAAGAWHVDAHSGWSAHNRDINNTHN